VRDTDGEVHVGLGFDYRLVDRLSVRGDARVLEMPSKQSWGLTTDVEATLGAVVVFGGRAHDGASEGAEVFEGAEVLEAAAVSAPPRPPVEPTRASEPLLPPVAMAPMPSARGQAIPAPAVASSSETDLESEAIPLGVPTVSDLLGRAKEIKFEIGSSRLADSSTPFLDELAAALTREPGVRLEIISHTANNGDAKKDLTLSKRRAETIKSVLVSKGVGTDQLIPIGRGSEEPIAPNITRTGKLRNERVELHRAAAFK
jgi:outer membrane protein OmpA-like peptidoglycan-associated protein